MGKVTLILKIIFFSLVVLNFLNCLVPETGFDALWYHLTLPKLFLEGKGWYFSGGLLYYSGMPRLAELLFIPLIKYLGFIGPKLLQFVSGLIICRLIFIHSRKLKLAQTFILVAVISFYATWIVSWQSSSGYVDLIRTVFEYSALLTAMFVAPALSGILIGLALGVKWQALVGLCLVLYLTRFRAWPYSFIVFIPWLIVSWYFTGNFLYPLNESFMVKTQLAQVAPDYYHPLQIIIRLISSPIFLTRPSEDFISPLAGLFVFSSLLSLLSSQKLVRQTGFVALFGAVALLMTPPPSTRYLLPYLPFLTVSFAYIGSKFSQKYQKLFLATTILSALVILAGRTIVLNRNSSFLLGDQTVNQYLAERKDKLSDTFIDSDDFAKNLPRSANYLIDNLHNLYYFPYPFDHTSWANPSKKYDYLITRGVPIKSLPGILLHTNSVGIQFIKL